MQKKAGQLSLADGLVRGANNFLAEADALIDWSEMEQQLEGIYSASTGRPSYPLLTLFKAMLLQQWYGLSDPRTEEAITDSISFRRFVGLSLGEAVPDHSTLSRFRAQLGNRFTKLQEAFNRQLDRRGLIVRQGTLIDASFVQSSSRQRRVDPEAGRYGMQQQDSISGYKMHMAVDQFSGLVRKVIVTGANINDSTPADELILGDEAAVYADRAYDKHERREALQQPSQTNRKRLKNGAETVFLFLSFKKRRLCKALLGEEGKKTAPKTVPTPLARSFALLPAAVSLSSRRSACISSRRRRWRTGWFLPVPSLAAARK